MLSWNNDKKWIELDGIHLKLPNKERRMVDLLANAPRSVVPYAKITAALGRYKQATLVKDASRIRQKIADAFGEGHLSVHCVAGVGMAWAGGIIGMPPTGAQATGPQVVLVRFKRKEDAA